MSAGPERRAPHQSARTKARKRALDILFEAEVRERTPVETLEERIADADPPVGEFTRNLVRGFATHALAVDQRVAESLPIEWTLERMPRVDRQVARIGVYELDYTSLPTAVVIAEAVELAQALSTDESPAFLNGLLAAAARTRQHPAD